ncbi:MAG: DUF5713 family protein, partial [Oscillospiraceae bacterium]|nr:DUF5713 family protein [Oscillospiraceae bacterium]
MDKKLLARLQKWHDQNKHDKIIKEILKVPQEKRDYELSGLLARAYNNSAECDKAIEQLLVFKERGETDPLWLFRLAYAYYYKDEDEKALALFEKCRALNPSDPDAELFINMINRAKQASENITPSYPQEWWLQTVTPPPEIPEIEYLADMYRDEYYPAFLVDKVKAELSAMTDFIMSGVHTYKEIQREFDAHIKAINGLQDEFYENDSELETTARESIGETVMAMLERFGIGIDIETAIR